MIANISEDNSSRNESVDKFGIKHNLGKIKEKADSENPSNKKSEEYQQALAIVGSSLNSCLQEGKSRQI